MLKINTNSVKFKIYFLFIVLNLIVFLIGVFLTAHSISIYSEKFLKERLKWQSMKTTMEFNSDRKFMLEKANDIVAHSFKTSFIKKIFPSKEISSIILIKLKNGRIISLKKIKYRYNKYERSMNLSDNIRFYKIINANNMYMYSGFGRDKSDKLISLRVIYWIIHKKSGFIIILNKIITSNFLRSIRIKNHMIANVGVYYGAERSAVSVFKNNRYLGIGQKVTKKQKMVLKNGESVYTSAFAGGIPFYIYNKPILNYDGKIIGILGAGIKKYRWFWSIARFYIPILFFIGLLIFIILIFILYNKKLTDPFYSLLKIITKIDPNNPQKLDLINMYQNKESEFYGLAKAITALNDKIMERQEENYLIVSSINEFSKNISAQDDINSLTIKLINLIVEKMGYSYSWFGVLDESNKEVKIISAYNNGSNYAKNLILKYDNSKYSENLVAKAIKSKSYAVINNVETDLTLPLYKERLLEYKFLSLGAFPIICGTDLIGILAVYSAKNDAFDSIKAGAILSLTNYVAYVLTYLKNFTRSLILSEIAESIMLAIITKNKKDVENQQNLLATFDEKEFLNSMEDNMETDFVEFIIYDRAKNEIKDAMFSKGWDDNIGVSSIAPIPTVFVQKKIANSMLDAYDYQNDEFATDIFKNMMVRDIIIYAFEGPKDIKYLAVTGVKNRRKIFSSGDMDFFRDAINLFASYNEVNILFESLETLLNLLENRENLISKMVAFGVVSIDLTNKTVNIYNDYFAQVFNIDKFLTHISLNEFFESIKVQFEDDTFADDIFQPYIANMYATAIESVKINLKSGIILNMKSNLFLTKDNKVIRLLIFENITDSENYIKTLKKMNNKLNLLYDLANQLSTVFTLEYALKIFAQGLYLVKNEKGGAVSSLHINIFDTVNKQTVTSLICAIKDEGDEEKDDSTMLPGKIIINTNNINYDDYIPNCKLLKNGKINIDIMVNDCEFKGSDGSYTCFSLKVSNEIVGTVSVDSKDKDFFTDEINGFIKEIINIASPVFAKLILIKTNKELAVTDPLTGVYNRRYMYEFAKMEIARAYRNSTDFSMAIVDIDKFKNINDSYGHQIGDDMLVKFTKDLKNVLMRQQDIITRYGGDEFIIILPDTGKQNAINLMEKLRDYFKNKVYVFENDININITISVGVASAEYLLELKVIDSDYDAEALLNGILRSADENLYRAKELGRNRVVG
ncbi:MAG: diguanylate cyclase [Candidatus Acididesulfobacter diazotrophicus]|uniref:Diguanylate cyclase n=1 Tax=Candidatus Acididesulfobacter diazotrophicus TaxID=2597226 RepID=A0A519BQH9_9DELT|nr:MAG: diguanylate cyclase [Candidatus Acididesulfobacter diazotrophicus]